MDKIIERVTIGILTYNHEKYIEQCLLSVFNLKYENLEIIISDDFSNDNTYDVIKNFVEKTASNHQIIVNKNPENLGLAANFNKTFYELAGGDFFITLGGDDILFNYNIEEALSFFNGDSEITMVDFNAEVINSEGEKVGIAATLDFDEKTFNLNDYLHLNKIFSFAPGRIFRSSLIHSFPPISPNCPTEDSVLVVRSILLGKLYRINKLKIQYRRHFGNISTAANLKKMSNIRIVSQYITDSIYLYNKNKMSDEILLKLLKRFNYEHTRREIVYSGLNKYNRILQQKLIKLKYKFL